MNLQQFMRAVVCPALAALCIASAGLFPAQTVAGKETEPIALPGASAVNQFKQAGQYESPQAARSQAWSRPGVRNTPGKRRLNADQLNLVLLSLREKSGWQSLYFDEADYLVCPDPQGFNGGSESARRLLGEAIFSDQAYDLEAHNASLQVAFAQLATGTDYYCHDTGAKLSARSLQIDFADFRQLRGDGPALKAFDLGLVILHELAHGVWRLHDAASEGEEPGECETYINGIRRELRLPERQSYFHGMRFGTLNFSKGDRLIAELNFIRKFEKPGQAIQVKPAKPAKLAKLAKPERFRLQWEAEMVGIITNFRRATKPGMAALR